MAVQSTIDPNATWAVIRRVYPIYCALCREFAIETEPCKELEVEGSGTPSTETVSQAKQWIAQLDQRVQIHQLRQFVQTSPQADEVALRALLSFLLNKDRRTEQDRDKVDFLLVQLFSQAAPSDVSGPGISLTEAAKIMQPVLGTIEISAVDWLEPLEDLLG